MSESDDASWFERKKTALTFPAFVHPDKSSVGSRCVGLSQAAGSRGPAVATAIFADCLVIVRALHLGYDDGLIGVVFGGVEGWVRGTLGVLGDSHCCEHGNDEQENEKAHCERMGRF